MTLRAIDGGTNYYAQFTNGLPTDPTFFPIGVWFESVLSQNDINLDKAVGINTYVVLTGNSNLDLISSNGMYAFLQQSQWKDNAFARNHPANVAWELHDEIDMQQGPGAGYTSLQNILNSLPQDGHLRYNNYGKGVMFWETDAEAARFVNDFQDITSADIYWYTDPNVDSFAEGGRFLTGQDVNLTEAQTDLAANYGYTVDRMRELDAMDGQIQPIWNFVEVGWPFTESAANGGEAIAPDEIQAAVMHSLIAGARGIIYFNHSFGGPNITQHALRDPAYAAQRTAVDQINALIQQLAPVLNSPFDDGYVTTSSGVRAMAKFYNNDHYIFAGSTQHASSTATFTLTGANSTMDGTATVINEGRTVTITDGVFRDFFADGEAWHVYDINLTATPPPPTGDTLTINDVTTTEGNSGIKGLVFTVTRTGSTAPMTFTFSTADGTATTADGDYVTRSQTVTLASGQMTSTIAVTINGDTKVEPNETFTATISNASNGATILDGVGVGTITNDDTSTPPPSTINGTVGHDNLRGTAGNDTINGLGGQDHIDGAAGNDVIHGDAGKDFLDGGAGADILWGDDGADQFILKAGEANGDTIQGFVGNGDRLGDLLMFSGFGDVQDGATFTRLDATRYQIHSAIDGHNEIITLAATVAPSDFVFI